MTQRIKTQQGIIFTITATNMVISGHGWFYDIVPGQLNSCRLHLVKHLTSVFYIFKYGNKHSASFSVYLTPPEADTLSELLSIPKG